MTGRLLAGSLLALLTAGPVLSQDRPELRVWEWRKLRNWLDDRQLAAIAADEAKLPDAPAFDRLVVGTLRDVHNRGADLYNTSKDFPGAFRMYEGALRTVRPLLAHRPAAQKIIEDGLAEAEKESSPAQKAFKLHETIEAVRKHLKEVSGKPSDKSKGTAEVEPKTPPDVAPPPRDKKTEPKKAKDPAEEEAGGLSGRVTYKGQPLAAAELALVSLDLARPRVFTAAVKDGAYSFAEPLPPSRYAVIVTGKGLPEKYSTTTNSGVVVEVKSGRSVADIDLA